LLRVPPDNPYGSLDAMLAAESGCTAEESVAAVIARDREQQRGRGGNNNPLGLGGKSHKAIDNVNGIHIGNQKEKRPAGTSQQRLLRRLRQAAESPYASPEVQAIFVHIDNQEDNRVSVNLYTHRNVG
jgi:hypothetical protein